MSDANAVDFGKFIPGFDFLQKLATSRSGASVPGLGGWVAPTVSVEELDKRIKELKAVQFWLEQNTTAIKDVSDEITAAAMRDLDQAESLKGRATDLNQQVSTFIL